MEIVAERCWKTVSVCSRASLHRCPTREQLVFECLDNGHPKQEEINFIHLTGLQTGMDFRLRIQKLCEIMRNHGTYKLTRKWRMCVLMAGEAQHAQGAANNVDYYYLGLLGRDITATRVLPRISAIRIRNMLQHTSAMVRKFGFGAPMSLSVSFCH
ncbi:hypothetical protein GE21DRAFT_1304587 [Neurospora crassa]|nr:hypothetical protein GE21DRAFT_1304587 [Neurospora crassa]